MSKKLKYSDLAKALNVKQATINMAVKRSHLIADKDKMIDINVPTNKVWLEGQLSKGKDFDINRIYLKIEPIQKTEFVQKTDVAVVVEKTPVNGNGKSNTAIEELRGLEVKQKKATLKRTQKAIQLDELKIKKQEGELIPYMEVEFLLSYIVEKIRSATIQELDSIANIYKDRFAISHDEYIEIKKDLNDIANGIIKDSVEEMKVGTKGIQEKYQDYRGKGERL